MILKHSFCYKFLKGHSKESAHYVIGQKKGIIFLVDGQTGAEETFFEVASAIPKGFIYNSEYLILNFVF